MVFRHEDADDILQNTFIKVWKNLDHFREESNLYTWIYRIATNETLRFIRNTSQNVFHPGKVLKKPWRIPWRMMSFSMETKSRKNYGEAVAALPGKTAACI